MSDPRTHLFANNASSALAANLSIAGGSLTVEDGSAFSDPDYLEIAIITVEDLTAGEREIMYCTARTGNVLTVERAKEGTSALAFDVSTNEVIVQQRVTAGLLEYLAETGGSGPGATELDDLTDVDVSGASAGDTIVLQSGEWVPHAFYRFLDDLENVDAEAPVDGHMLVWDDNLNLWVMQAQPTEKVVIQVACSDMVSDLVAATGVAYCRAPKAFTIDSVRSSLYDASSSGLVTVDINVAGSTILSTKLSIDATEKTSTTAATPAVISDTTVDDDAEIVIDLDAAGTDAKGLIVTINGHVP